MSYEFYVLILNLDLHFITDFYRELVSSFRLTMSTRLQEIRRKIAKLEEEAKELKRLKSDCDDVRKLRRMLVKEKVD